LRERSDSRSRRSPWTTGERPRSALEHARSAKAKREQQGHDLAELVERDVRERLPYATASTLELQAERALASIEELALDSAYMADLDGEIEATARAYVGAAVSEIATFRAELSRPQVG
jgi:hypothetical protein